MAVYFQDGGHHGRGYPYTYNRENYHGGHNNAFIFHRIVIKLADKQDSHKILDEFEFRPHPSMFFFLLLLLFFIFDRIFVKFAGNKDMYKISDQFDFRPNRTICCGIACL